jgi:hypothetical protein
MRNPYFLFFVLFLLSGLLLNAQSDVVIRKKELKQGKSGFAEAWKHVSQGDDYYLLAGAMYGYAFDEYVKAGEYNGTNPELNYKTGVAALFSDHKEKAFEYFKKAMDMKGDVAPDILFLTGRSLQYRGEYKEAEGYLERYLGSPVRKGDQQVAYARKYIDECKAASLLVRDTIGVEIADAGTAINSPYDDYSELISGNEMFMIYASRRPLPKSSNYYPDAKFDENIYVAAVQDDSWAPSIPADKRFTTPYCETPVFINAAGDSLYIYTGYENKGNIKLSVKKKVEWQVAEQINPDFNSVDNETSFTISPSGDEIWFVSNRRKGSVGGKDIYFIRKSGSHKWSEPQNAGPVINSSYDEESVRFSVTGDTLWFSSRGHDTMGGFDIFYTVRNKAGEWDTVRNAGYPLNSQWDELFYYPAPVEKDTFYFVSNRPGGVGGLDIYKGHFLKSKLISPVLSPGSTVSQNN